jgi:hypothetical protein
MFARYLLDKFPDANEQIRQRLLAAMIIRRKRILYRRSRYGKAPKKAPQEGPARPQLGRRVPKANPQAAMQPAETPGVQTTEPPTLAEAPREEGAQEKSVGHTATTLRPEKFQKASSPSVISTSQSVALSGHEELSFPPPPCGALFRSYNKMKKSSEASLRREEEITNRSIDGEPNTSFNMMQARRYINQRHLQKLWERSVEALGEVTCPYCFHTIPAQEAVDNRKWRYIELLPRLKCAVCLFHC